MNNITWLNDTNTWLYLVEQNTAGFLSRAFFMQFLVVQIVLDKGNGNIPSLYAHSTNYTTQTDSSFVIKLLKVNY